MSLTATTTRAVFWNGLELFARQGLQFVVSVILARLLSPSEFGVMAMLLVFIGLASVLIDGGFPAALVQKQQTTHDEESAAFYFGIVSGLILGLGLGLSGPLIAGFFRQPVLALLSWLMGFNLFLGAFGAVHAALLLKQLDFRTLMKVGISATAVSGVVAIALAWLGAGVWALATQAVTATAVTVLLLWRLSPWRPARTFDPVALRGMFGYGGFLLMSALLEQVYLRFSSIVIGRTFGAHEVGLFSRAEGIRQVPVGVITGVVGRVAFPAFSQLVGDSERLRRGVQGSLQALMVVSIPAMLGMLVVAEPLVVTLFGEPWRATIPLLRVLCLAGLFWPLHAINLYALMAQGQSRECFRVETVKRAIGLLLLLAAVPFGLLAMAWSQVALALIAFFLNAHYTGVNLQYGAVRQIRHLFPYLAVGALMAGAVWMLDRVLLDMSMAVRLVLDVAAGVLVYAGACAAVQLQAFVDLASVAMAKVRWATARALEDRAA